MMKHCLNLPRVQVEASFSKPSCKTKQSQKRPRTKFSTSSKATQIGQSPQGSRCLETCFEKASWTRKQAIAAENALKGTAFGRAVLSKLQINLFKRDAKQWVFSNQSSKKSNKRKAEDDQGDKKDLLKSQE
jgi:hypothetical protein